MHWADIQAAINKTGTLMAEIAREEDVSQSLVSMVIRGTKTSYPVAYAIAAKTGIPTERLWPGKYKVSPAQQRAAA